MIITCAPAPHISRAGLFIASHGCCSRGCRARGWFLRERAGSCRPPDPTPAMALLVGASVTCTPLYVVSNSSAVARVGSLFNDTHPLPVALSLRARDRHPGRMVPMTLSGVARGRRHGGASVALGLLVPAMAYPSALPGVGCRRTGASAGGCGWLFLPTSDHPGCGWSALYSSSSRLW